MLRTGIWMTLMSAAMATSLAFSKTEFEMTIPGFEKVYPMVAPAGDKGVQIAYVYDMIDNIDMLEQAAKAMVEGIKQAGLLKDIDAVVIPGDKGNALAALFTHELRTFAPHIKLMILRSSAKGGSHISTEYSSITGGGKSLHMREDQFHALKNTRVMVVDDVISTGGTVRATKSLVEQAGGRLVAYGCIATEGVRDSFASAKGTTFDSLPLVRLVHLPVILGPKA